MNRSDEVAEIGACCVTYVNTAAVAAIASQMPQPAAMTAMAETFKLLGDATRLRIIYALSRGELCVCDLAAMLGVGTTTISTHLRLLRSSRLVRFRRDGKLVYYTLEDAHIGRLLAECLDHVQDPKLLAVIR